VVGVVWGGGGGYVREKDHFGETGVNRRMILNLQEVGCRGMGWIELAQDRDRWWTLVNS